MKESHIKNTPGKRVSLLVTLFGILMLFFNHCRANELMVGFGQDKPPFIIGKTRTGLEIDIFREALAYKGHTMKASHMSNRRLQNALLTTQNVDAVATVRQVPGDGLYYVDEFIYFDNFAISKARDNLTINEVSDLIGLSILTWQNAYRDLGPEFERAFDPSQSGYDNSNYMEHYSQESQTLMFWEGRAQVIVIDKTIFGWHSKQLSDRTDTTQEVVYHPIFSGRTYFQAAFGNEALAKDFEAGLEHLKSTGRYGELYRKYITKRGQIGGVAQ